MSGSCAVYGFPLLLDSKLEFEDAYGTVDERLVDCEDFAAFQDFNSVSSSDYDQALDRRFFSLFDEQHMDFSQGSHPKDSGILLEQGFEPTFVYNNCCKSTTSTVECHPAFDVSPEEHKDQNLEWMDTAPNMTLDWPQEQQQSIMMPEEERESQTAMVQGTDEQYWFPCPQLEGQVLPQQQNALHDQPDVYGFKQLCPETFESISVNDPGNLALQVHFGNVEFCEQQEKASDQKPNRPVSKPTNGRSRSARKRRSVPYQVPFPCCTSRKSVEELIAEKNLEFLLQKELKPSDVGNLGRIVLPKKEAESALPYLTVREGMTMIMEDLTTAYKWHMRYRFWPNNKSRMYLLENTGEWIRSHCLKEGDFLRLYKYRDADSGKYVILGKKASSLPDMGCNKIVKSVRSKRVKRKNAEESSSGSEESLCQF